MAYYYGWKPYVPVAKRRRQAEKKMQQLRKKGVDIQPVEIEGRKIAHTFWGEAWCSQMESHGDFANRLPRGRTYVRNGSVCHLSIEQGQIKAMVSGSELYNVVIKIDVLPRAKWKKVKQQCSGQIGSLLELLQGRISSSVMEVVTDSKNGLFPLPREIHLDCDCPDYATMCKHAAAVLYGVGARLDRQPELLFRLRGVDHLDLVAAPADEALAQATRRGGRRRRVASGDLADVFGIELDAEGQAEGASAVESQAGTSAQEKPKRTKKSTKAPRQARSTAGEEATEAAGVTAAKRPAKKRQRSATASSPARKKSAKPRKNAAAKKGGATKSTTQAAPKSNKRK